MELLSIQIRLLICSVDKAREIGIDWWSDNRFLCHQNQPTNHVAANSRQELPPPKPEIKPVPAESRVEQSEAESGLEQHEVQFNSELPSESEEAIQEPLTAKPGPELNHDEPEPVTAKPGTKPAKLVWQGLEGDSHSDIERQKRETEQEFERKRAALEHWARLESRVAELESSLAVANAARRKV